MSAASTIVTAAMAAKLAEQCSARDWAIMETVNELRLVSGIQLEQLHFFELTGRSRSVTRWRVLQRLTAWRVIAPLDRRVGGAPRGSAGAVYALDVAGYRLLRLRHEGGDHRRLRRPYTPGLGKVKHTLAVSDLFVGLTQQTRSSGFAVDIFRVEPSYAASSGRLNPDAYAVLSTEAASDHWWIEVDLATEALTTLRRKIEAYSDFYRQGRYSELGIMPRVLITVPHDRRLTQVQAQLTRLPGAGELVSVVLHEQAVPYLMAMAIGSEDAAAGE